MRVLNLRTAALALVAGIGLGGCAYNPYGSGLGVGVGYGNNGYNDPYYGGYGNYGYGYSPYSAGYGYGYGQPYYGWNDGFYYPGTGYYVYDRYRNPYRWSDAQRRYWEARRERAKRNGVSEIIQSWGHFEEGPSATPTAVRQQSVSPTRQMVERKTVKADKTVKAERQQVRRSERTAKRSERVAQRRDDRRRKPKD